MATYKPFFIFNGYRLKILSSYQFLLHGGERKKRYESYRGVERPDFCSVETNWSKKEPNITN